MRDRNGKARVQGRVHPGRERTGWGSEPDFSLRVQDSRRPPRRSGRAPARHPAARAAPGSSELGVVTLNYKEGAGERAASARERAAGSRERARTAAQRPSVAPVRPSPGRPAARTSEARARRHCGAAAAAPAGQGAEAIVGCRRPSRSCNRSRG